MTDPESNRALRRRNKHERAKESSASSGQSSATPEASESRKTIALRWGILFFLAISLRVLHLSEMRGDPWIELPIGDAAGFDQWANQIADGEMSAPWYQAPLYPYLLSVVYAAGFDAEIARWLQALMGAAACVLIADATRRWCGLRCGFVAGLIAAFYAPALFYEALLLKCALASLLFSLMVWLWSLRSLVACCSRATVAWGLGFGLTLAALVMSREHAWVLVPVSMAALLMGRRGDGAQAGQALGWRSCASVALGFVIGLAPLVFATHARTGEYSLGTGNFGPNLYIGNHEGADGLYQSLMPGRGRIDAERTDTIRIAEAALGRELSPSEVSNYWSGQALEWIKSNPWSATGLFISKLQLALNQHEWMDSQSFEMHRERSRLAAIFAWVSNFGVLLMFAGLGFMQWERRAHAERSLHPAGQLPFSMIAFGGALLIALASFFVMGRFRFALVAFLAPFAANGLLMLIDTLRSRDSSRMLRTLFSCLPFIPITFMTVNVEEHPIADSAINLGSALHELGRTDEARAAYDRAIEAWPESADAYFNRGRLFAGLGNETDARKDLLEAARLEAAYLSDTYVLLARMRQDAGDLQTARRTLIQAIDADPQAPGPPLQLGSVLRQLAMYKEAEFSYRRSLQLDPKSAAAHNDLAFLLAGLGREEEGIQLYRQALDLDAQLGPAISNLGWLLATASQRDLRDEAESMALADRLAAQEGAESPYPVELRAAAHASAGRWSEAERAATQAAQLAQAGGETETANRCSARAKAYSQKRDWKP
ncbi:MAG: tetratricopeptide (TPR) repeat protein [Planctomycetota bacterium]